MECPFYDFGDSRSLSLNEGEGFQNAELCKKRAVVKSSRVRVQRARERTYYEHIRRLFTAQELFSPTLKVSFTVVISYMLTFLARKSLLF